MLEFPNPDPEAQEDDDLKSSPLGVELLQDALKLFESLGLPGPCADAAEELFDVDPKVFQRDIGIITGQMIKQRGGRELLQAAVDFAQSGGAIVTLDIALTMYAAGLVRGRREGEDY